MSATEAIALEQVLDKASVNRDAGRLDEAARLYRSILQKNPQNAEAQKALHNLRKVSDTKERGAINTPSYQTVIEPLYTSGGWV